MKPSISIIVPALNEEKSLALAIDTILGAVDDRFSQFEIIIFDDHSSDSTGEIAENFTKTNPNIRVVHNPHTMGFGYNFRRGVELANYDYVVMFPGDDDVEGSSMVDMFGLIGSGDCIISHTLNIPCDRPLWRRSVSRLFTVFLNVVFGLDLSYYNGVTIYKSDVIRDVEITTHGFAYQVEALVKILKQGRSFRELGINLKGRRFGRTNALKLNNIISVIKAFLNLFWKVKIKERKKYSAKARRV